MALRSCFRSRRPALRRSASSSAPSSTAATATAASSTCDARPAGAHNGASSRGHSVRPAGAHNGVGRSLSAAIGPPVRPTEQPHVDRLRGLVGGGRVDDARRAGCTTGYRGHRGCRGRDRAVAGADARDSARGAARIARGGGGSPTQYIHAQAERVGEQPRRPRRRRHVARHDVAQAASSGCLGGTRRRRRGREQRRRRTRRRRGGHIRG